MYSTNAPEASRKWGTYHAVGVLIKSYFKVCVDAVCAQEFVHLLSHHRQANRIALTKNVLRAISAQPDLPLLSEFPLADQVAIALSSESRHIFQTNYNHNHR